MGQSAVIGRRGRVFLALVALGCGSNNNRSQPYPPAPDAAGGTGGATGPYGGVPDAAVSVGEAGLVSTGRLFPESSAWYRDVTALPADVESPAMIAALGAAGGFGEFLIDFSFEVNTAGPTDPVVQLTPGPDFFTPDCDQMPVPLPPGGAVRDETGYQCTKDGECHLLVLQQGSHRLFELWKASVQAGVLTAGCLAVWDLSRVYGPSGRGTDCASADASGMPITALLFTADEVAAGEIPHALRLSLPADRIRPGVYLSPATHASRSPKGGPNSLPLGARLRLRPDFPTEGLSQGAKVVVKALQRYGMLLAEGGPRPLTARSDRSTTARWAGLLGDRDLTAIKASDFTVVDGGPRIKYGGDCVRNP
jgi:serine/threonine-protein kinase